MHTDARTLDNQITFDTDVCIVGAGAAGISIAYEFLDAGHNVLLAESGGFEFDAKTQKLYDVEDIGSPPYPHMATRTSRLRYFGGTTNRWGGMSRPMDPIDFEPRSWVPFSGWPVGQDVIAPFYERAQNLCDAGPLQYDNPEYWENAKNGRVRLPLSKAVIETKVYQYSGRKRFAEAFRDALVTSPNVHLLTHANLVDVETGDDGRHVTRLRFLTLDGTEIFIRSSFVILAAGAIENARVLLASTSTHSTGIGNTRDQVGRFFMEHAHVYTATIEPVSNHVRAYLYGHFFVEDVAARALLHIADSFQRERKMLNAAGALYPTRHPGWRALRDLVKGLTTGKAQYGITNDLKWLLRDLEGTFKGVLDSFRGDVGTAYDPPHFYTFEEPLRLFLKLEQQPNPDSRITLSSQTDELGVPLAKLDWRLTDEDNRTAREATKAIRQQFEESGLAKVEVYDWIRDNASGWSSIEVYGHHIGTTRMGSDPTQSVVDSDCRLHEVDNLFIAGSSVFPTAGCVNPTLTIIALAIRLADHLKALLKRQST